MKPGPDAGTPGTQRHPPRRTSASARGGLGPRRHLILLAKVALTVGLLLWLLRRTDLGALAGLFRGLDVPVFLACVGLYAGGQLLSTYRWQILLQAEGIRISLPRLVLLYFEGMFFNLFLPSLIGGDVVRGYRVYRATGGRESSVASVLVERISGFCAMICIALLALAVGYPSLRDPQVAAMILLLALGFVVALACLTSEGLKARLLGLLERWRNQALLAKLAELGEPDHKRLSGRLRRRLLGALGSLEQGFGRFYEALHRYRGHRRVVARAVGLSFLFQGLIIVIYFVLGIALHLQVPLRYFFLFVPLITAISMVPVTLAGLGLREGSAVYLFAKVGLGSAQAISLSLLWFATMVAASSLGGLVFVLGAHREKALPLRPGHEGS